MFNVKCGRFVDYRMIILSMLIFVNKECVYMMWFFKLLYIFI